MFGTALRPRLSFFRSNKNVYAQLIDDSAGKTLASAHTREIKKGAKDRVSDLAVLLAKKALDLGIKSVVFDRGGYQYHGNVKKFADAARGGGLKF